MRKILKISSFVLCFVLLLSSFSIVAFAEGETNEETNEEETILLGDMDSNGKVDTNDARLILRLAANMEIATDDMLLLGDMNSDGAITVEDAILALRQAISIGGVIIPDKNGENYLTDDPNNEFIKLIADKYDLDPASLVAIYSVPDSGTNYVLRFEGERNVLGVERPPYKKSVDNLYYVYHIGAAPERVISYTNGEIMGGDHYNCSVADGAIVFNLVQSTVMSQYPDYFEGVEQTEE